MGEGSRTDSLKGLQVRMLDDPLELGIKPVAKSFNFGELTSPEGIGSEFDELIGWLRDKNRRSGSEEMDLHRVPRSGNGATRRSVLICIADHRSQGLEWVAGG
jgi:hypothetical protein